MVFSPFRPLPRELRLLQLEIEEQARSYGLDFFETIFELVTHEELNAIAAMGGFPNRYPHWRFGMEFEQLQRGYTYGLSKIYELVINNDPCYAYLMDSNQLVDQKLVMAHVMGHCDFFKNNIWFSQTNRKMMDEMANHGNRIRQFMDKYGVSEVEDFLDICFSLEDLIDMHSPFIRRREAPSLLEPEDRKPRQPTRFEAKEYMDSYINPRQAMREESERYKQELEKQSAKHPVEPERDVLLYLIENAPLNSWQREVLSIVREEAYYFAPQGQTKIMNEGWASYWHSTIMCQRQLTDAEVIDFADHHSGTMAMPPGSLNPYKIGLELFRDIEDRWNTGKFGKEFEECDDMVQKRTWNRNLNLGREKIFEVRKIHNDITFIDEFLTPEFCKQHKLFSYAHNSSVGTYEIESRQFQKIKERFLFQLTNHSRPFIYVKDSNYANRGELLLWHKYFGVELKLSEAKDTLENLWKLWRRPVHLETVAQKKVILLSYDGTIHTQDTLEKEVHNEY